MATIYSNNETININPTDDLVLYKEEFINSRIEKFLYAICALDFDDLPTPLSRIEELYKCLATGLPAPTFVPQSRVEKYLMAILGAYDANDLPTPQSRTEVLLNKILMGDTDLSDIEWLKSRYEFLLAYIAKGGEISSGYLQYTFSSSAYSMVYTKELPVKSAVLKGQTLVNCVSLVNNISISDGNSISSDGYITVTANSDYSNAFLGYNAIKNSTEYLCILEIKENTANSSLRLISNDSTSIFQALEIIPQGSTGIHKFIFTTASNADAAIYSFRSYLTSESTSGHVIYRVMLIEYQDGMENWDIPYFEGIGSVENPAITTTGKNLYPYGDINFTSSYTSWHDAKGNPWMWGNVGSKSKSRFLLKKGTYSTSSNFSTRKNMGAASLVTDNETAITDINKTKPFVLSEDTYLTLRPRVLEANVPTFLDGIQIEEGSVVTEYEPYKTTTVTCEGVELRGIGDVKDELNLLTGKVTRRIGEIVLDGSEKWYDYTSKPSDYPADPTTIKFTTGDIADKISRDSSSVSYMNCDSLKVVSADYCYTNDEEVICERLKTLRIAIKREKLETGDISGLKLWLSKNPITVQYELYDYSVETVDCLTINQDGNNAELSSFEDITHVRIDSEGLIPEIEMEVASQQIEEDLTTLSLGMNNIATTQEELEESVDKQTGDVDSTMMAITEIYEQIL